MNLQGRNLALRMQGDDVGLLQDELRRLGAAISFDEIGAKTFGVTTREAVIKYQQEHAPEASGIVDARTTAQLTADIATLDAAGRGFLVYGRILGADGGLTVRAFDRDLRSEERLGEVAIADGTYEIAYSAEQFSRAEKGRADIVV